MKYSFLPVGLFALMFMLTPTAGAADLVGSAEVEAGSKIGDVVEVTTTSEAEAQVISETEGDAKMEGETRGSLKVNARGVAVTSSSQVETESDLLTFEANAATKNSSLVTVKTRTEADGAANVEVVYRHKAKLLGFIPVTMRSRTTVTSSAEGSADVVIKLPWWRFLATGSAFDSAKLKARIQNNATVKAQLKANASAQAKAEAAEAVLAEIEAEAQARASATVK